MRSAMISSARTASRVASSASACACEIFSRKSHISLPCRDASFSSTSSASAAAMSFSDASCCARSASLAAMASAELSCTAVATFLPMATSLPTFRILAIAAAARAALDLRVLFLLASSSSCNSRSSSSLRTSASAASLSRRTLASMNSSLRRCFRRVSASAALPSWSLGFFLCCRRSGGGADTKVETAPPVFTRRSSRTPSTLGALLPLPRLFSILSAAAAATRLSCSSSSVEFIPISWKCTTSSRLWSIRQKRSSRSRRWNS
mmetsp:Transcript_7716/g.31267  ORF Transcript_7716/g.31267 Transcript_7716/m.31267 type:complete len:263 (+) Transcript_7716:4040-4828(+)